MKKSKANDFDDCAKREKPNRRKKRSSKAADLSDVFYVDADKWQQVEQNIEQGFYARVVEVHKRYSFISPESELGKIATRDVWLATVARKFLQAERSERNFVCVGDMVFCCPADENSPVVSEDLPHCSIELALKRKNSISRVDPRIADRRHVLASNIDQLVIVASYLNPTVKWGLIDRYIVLAESEGIVPSIILNKKDLLDEVEKERFKEECLNYADYYEKIGYRVLRLQAENKDTVDAKSLNQLEEMFSDRISLISGHSGVGKSSIVNLLGPEITQDVETDGIFYKGRHTTTYASLIKLKKGGYIVDTPGIRSFAIEERTATELSWCFVEMRDLLGQCKYRECNHVDEPDCAVRDSVAAGRIPEWRYKSYLAILTGATGREGRLRDIVETTTT